MEMNAQSFFKELATDNFVRCHINPDYRHPPRRCGEQVLIGPVTMPAIVRERIALDPSAAPKSALVVIRWLPGAR
jgi:hypothetical protein